MKTKFSKSSLRKVSRLAGALIIAACLPAVAGSTNEVATEYRNWITFGGGGTFISGDKAQFMQRSQLPKYGFGGIEDFHWEQDVGKKGLFELNGSGIYDSHNFGVNFKLSDPDKGYVKAGYEQFRTWYDGNAGYFPGGTNRWRTLTDNQLGLDRGRAWFEAGLTLPDAPIVIFRYEHEFHDGQKSSTEWSDASVVGTPGVWPTPTATSPTLRAFAPTFYDISEKRDTFSLDVKHTIGKTDFGIGLRYQRLDNNDATEAHRRPGEITGTTAQRRADRYMTERQTLTEDLFNVRAYSDTRFNDKTRMTVGGSFTTFDTDIGGSRIFGNGYDPVVGNYLRSQSRDAGFINLSGGSRTKDYIGNINLMFTPFDKFVVVPSFRFESETMDGDALFLPTTVNAAGGPLVTNAITRNATARDSLEVTEALEMRYTGFTNWSLYARAELSQTTGRDLYQIFTNSVASLNERENWQRDRQKYTVGANWYPLRRLNFSGQYYYKVSDYDYALRSAIHDMNFQVHWRPHPTVSFVGRYDYQIANFHGFQDGETGETTAHILSGTVNWTPLNWLYAQIGASYSFENTFTTPAATSAGATNVVPNLNNGYLTANAMLGFALDRKTDLTLGYTFYKADNYVDNSKWSVPFGAADEQHTVSATLSRQLTKQLRGSLKYGYFWNHDAASGGNNDYAAHLIYATIQCRF